jgi:hypothetical protein
MQLDILMWPDAQKERGQISRLRSRDSYTLASWPANRSIFPRENDDESEELDTKACIPSSQPTDMNLMKCSLRT